jgi:putative PIN family toxin of toxin-antitoxin system
LSIFVPAVHRPVVVLDTNVCLDWLIFDDPRTARLALAVQSSRVDWIASPSMRAEFSRVLSYKAIRHRVSSVAEVLDRYDSWSRTTSEPGLTASHGLVCEDPDDQTFIDLALEHRATWLFSRDQMVCRLAPQAALLGVVIVTPDSFAFGGEA